MRNRLAAHPRRAQRLDRGRGVVRVGSAALVPRPSARSMLLPPALAHGAAADGAHRHARQLDHLGSARAAARAGPHSSTTATVRYLLRQQHPSGGWSWYQRGAPDSNDTAAAIEALRAAGVRGKPITHGLVYLRSLQRKDGGFALVSGRVSDSQSHRVGDPWRSLLAAGKKPPAAAFRFLGRMRRADGSYRYWRATRSHPSGSPRRCCPRLPGSRFRRGDVPVDPDEPLVVQDRIVPVPLPREPARDLAGRRDDRGSHGGDDQFGSPPPSAGSR